MGYFIYSCFVIYSTVTVRIQIVSECFQDFQTLELLNGLNY